MAELVYILCASTSIICAIMLMRQYRLTTSHLLLWSALCFIGLALSNTVLVVDLVVVPEMDIDGPFWRTMLSAISGSLLLFGLIWEIT